MSFLFQIERSDRKGRRKTSFQAGKTKRSFGVCIYKPVACLPKFVFIFARVKRVLNFATQNFTQIIFRTRSDHEKLLHGIPTLKKWCISAHLLFCFRTKHQLEK